MWNRITVRIGVLVQGLHFMLFREHFIFLVASWFPQFENGIDSETGHWCIVLVVIIAAIPIEITISFYYSMFEGWEDRCEAQDKIVVIYFS
ncbi:hypothetical protein VNO78_03356 [Psophocarpus tetragonolobus]|uniref:Uncharacterized protein n=1 Tax=Psophocarpus tetragonolobus TaxID=3891 RepID=A0AAN9T0A2_PSOTE